MRPSEVPEAQTSANSEVRRRVRGTHSQRRPGSAARVAKCADEFVSQETRQYEEASCLNAKPGATVRLEVHVDHDLPAAPRSSSTIDLHKGYEA